MGKALCLTFASSLTDLCEVNSSFDSGVLRIAYPGANRNKSYISKETFEKCIPTIFNCPIVCNYDRDSDTLGGHDIDIVKDSSGNLKMVNLTEPVGVIPESAKLFWETVEEDDGAEREYLCSEVLLWKRQEAYQKIKESGCTKQSMEITVNDGEQKDGVYYIYDFEFTAFALIGCEPCFESASLEFSMQNFKNQFSQMMLEVKESFKQIDTSIEDDNKQNLLTKGGKMALNEKLELLAKYNISADDLDFSIDDISLEELESRLSVTNNEPNEEHNFELEGSFRDELIRALDSITVQTEWGEMRQYIFVDYDKDVKEVFCWDANDWLLYGFAYDTNGDAVNVDFESKKRKKWQIVDFDEGEQPSPFAEIFSLFDEKIKANSEMAEKYQQATKTIAEINSELTQLREFKSATEAEKRSEAVAELFSKFTDLESIEAFQELQNNADKYSVEELEEKCFALRGRNFAYVKAPEDPAKGTTKIMVGKHEIEKEPYGGVFQKYGIKSE